jgi:undecaprenyl-diphosphatase
VSYLQAIIMGILQGVTELFPISSLGHGVLFPALFGWHNLVASQTANESFFLAFLVGLHVGTAVALLVYYRRTWASVIGGAVSSVRERRIATAPQRLAWLLIVGTIPVGIVGLAFEHKLRVIFAKPLAASVFLIINGVILLLGEWVRRRTLMYDGHLRAPKGRHVRVGAAVSDEESASPRTLEGLSLWRGLGVGCAQILALFAGISRSGMTMVAGISQGMDHEDSARFSFLLATPVILLAGLYKLPDLFGVNGDGVRGQCLVGAIAAGLAAYAAVRFLVRWFETKTLWPFGVYCLVVGALCTVRFA